TLESSQEKSTLFRKTNFSEKSQWENWEEFDQEIHEKTYLQDARLVYVVSVEEAGEAECFDLEMEDQSSPYFLAQGVVVHNCYQEQIMKMAQDLAGYSLGEADLLRRCLSGSTKIIDAATGNLVSLKEIAAKPEYWLSRKVFSLDIKSQQIVRQPITEIHPNGTRDVWEITTRTNRKIRATNDHLFYTVLGWKPLKDFSVGDRLGLAKEIPINHNIDKVVDVYHGKVESYFDFLNIPKQYFFIYQINHLAANFASESFRSNSNSQVGEKIFDLTTSHTPNQKLSSHGINHLATTFTPESFRENSNSQIIGKILNFTAPDADNSIANIELIPQTQKVSFI
ncbi:MAG: hypothetical protein SWX82_28920, partial [Cyanobacteriota bacterium]|nr:hypothetical protein [Cyanobacteriota bacterium]